MSTGLSTNGAKKVSTFCKEFNAKYPYLRLKICPPEAKALVAKGESISGVDMSKTLSEVRTKKGRAEISCIGSRTVERIENQFESEYGLYAQICYTTDKGRYYTGGTDQKKSLAKLNREKAAEGCKKGEWK